MVDPTNFYAIDDVRMVSGCEVRPVIASQREIMRAINQAYGVHELVEKAVGKLKTDDPDNREAVHIAEDAPVVNIVNAIISRAVKERASDVHFGGRKLLCEYGSRSMVFSGRSFLFHDVCMRLLFPG